MLFLGIISWKGASRFNGGFVFQMGGFIFKWGRGGGGVPHGGHWFCRWQFQVTISYSFLKLTASFHKNDQKTFQGISGLHLTTFVNILPKLRYYEGRNYIQIGCKLFSTFIFLIDQWKVGTSWIFRKGGNLRKGEVDLEKGGYDPLTNYASCIKKKINSKCSLLFLKM